VTFACAATGALQNARVQNGAVVVDSSVVTGSAPGSFGCWLQDSDGQRSTVPTVAFTVADGDVLEWVAGATGCGAASGNPTPLLACFQQPYGIHVNKRGTILVADYRGYGIRAIALNGTVTTVAGTLNSPSPLDGPIGVNERESDHTIFITESTG